jgi:hypothetical protein
VKAGVCMTKSDMSFEALECTSCRMQIVSPSVPCDVSKDERQTNGLLRTWHDLKQTDALAALL